jgi:ABC-2 type transport system permease protein
MIENFRDWKIMIMTLSLAPFFVILMYSYLEQVPETYRIVVVNYDEGVTGGRELFNAGQDLASALRSVRSPDGVRVLEVQMERDLVVARERLQSDGVDLIVEIPAGLSRSLHEYRASEVLQPAVIRTYGDPASPSYMMAAVWSDVAIYEYAAAVAGLESPLVVEPLTVGTTTSSSDFELYVPALLVLAIIMLMFTAAASLIREKDKGTIVRLRISNMTTFEWLAAVSLVQILVGLLAMGLTYLTAVALGYETTGSMWALLVVGAISSLSVMAISVLVAAFLRTIFDLMTVGSFPFFVLMFFSGGMLPLPQIRVFELLGHSIAVTDVLPTSHSIDAMGNILNSGALLGDVAFELGAIAVLTLAYYWLGARLFSRRHMRAAR